MLSRIIGRGIAVMVALAVTGAILFGIGQAIDVYGQYREESIRHGNY